MTRALAAVVTIAFFAAAPSVAHADPMSKDSCADAYVAAQRLRQKRQLLAARKELRVCGADGCPAVLLADCRAWLADTESALPSVVLAVRAAGGAEGHDVPGARVLLDGEALPPQVVGAAVDVEPGPHTLRAIASGYAAADVSFVAREGEKRRPVTVSLVPLASTAPAPLPDVAPRRAAARSPWVYVLAGTGAALLAGAGYFALSGLGRRGDLGECRPGCDPSDVQATNRDFLIADVLFGAGAVAIGTAAFVRF